MSKAMLRALDLINDRDELILELHTEIKDIEHDLYVAKRELGDANVDKDQMADELLENGEKVDRLTKQLFDDVNKLKGARNTLDHVTKQRDEVMKLFNESDRKIAHYQEKAKINDKVIAVNNEIIRKQEKEFKATIETKASELFNLESRAGKLREKIDSQHNRIVELEQKFKERLDTQRDTILGLGEKVEKLNDRYGGQFDIITKLNVEIEKLKGEQGAKKRKPFTTG